MKKTLLKNGIIVTMNPAREIYYGGYVLIEGSRILQMGPSAPADADQTADEVIDCSGRIVLPGFINTHTHLFQNLLKGLGDDMALDRWLSTMTFPAATNLDPEHCFHAARAGCLEAMHSGVTTTLDYMYPHPRGGLSEGVIRGMKETGIRGILGRGCMDCGEEFGVQPGIMQKTAEIEKDAVSLLDKYAGDPLLSVWLAPAAVWSNSRKNLIMLNELRKSYRTGLTVHISETPFDRKAAETLHGLPDIDVLIDLGITGSGILMVHCVYLGEEDQNKTVRHGMTVSHNAVSNMYLASGTAPVPAMRKKGIPVSLGVDGAASNNSQDMLELMKSTALIHKAVSCNPLAINAESVLEMATIEGARCLGLESEIGSLEPGKKADIVLFDPRKSGKSVPLHNPVSTIVYSSSEQNIDSVMVDGNFRIREGVYLGTVSRDRVFSECQTAAEDLARRGGMTNRMAGHHWPLS